MKYYTGNNTGDTPGNLPDPYFCTALPATVSAMEELTIPLQGGKLEQCLGH